MARRESLYQERRRKFIERAKLWPTLLKPDGTRLMDDETIKTLVRITVKYFHKDPMDYYYILHEIGIEYRQSIIDQQNKVIDSLSKD